MIAGTAYGAALNDRLHLERMALAFRAPPYKAPPRAPVLYIKPRPCFGFGGAPIPLPGEISEVEAAATIGLLFARDLTRASPEEVRGAVGAACLALDISEPPVDPEGAFYRPGIRERCRDGFLPLGGFSPLPAAFGEIVTEIDGREAHCWSLARLARPVEALAAEISQFMTLRAGDLLLVGLPGDAPRASLGQSLAVRSAGLAPLTTRVVAEEAP